MSSEQIQALNKIISIIDEKATHLKDSVYDLNPAQRYANKKLILDLIGDALKLASTIKPAPEDAIFDLKKLSDQISQIHH